MINISIYNKVCARDLDNNLSKEMTKVSKIMALFSIAYLLRFLDDAFVNAYLYLNYFYANAIV